jgi:hypothetical protein
MDEIIGGWTKLHNEDLCNLYSKPNIIRVIKSRIRWVGHVACMWEKRNAYKVLVGKSDRRKPLGRPRHKWEDNNKMDFRDIELGVWTGLVCLRMGTSGKLL